AYSPRPASPIPRLPAPAPHATPTATPVTVPATSPHTTVCLLDNRGIRRRITDHGAPRWFCEGIRRAEEANARGSRDSDQKSAHFWFSPCFGDEQSGGYRRRRNSLAVINLPMTAFAA